MPPPQSASLALAQVNEAKERAAAEVAKAKERAKAVVNSGICWGHRGVRGARVAALTCRSALRRALNSLWGRGG